MVKVKQSDEIDRADETGKGAKQAWSTVYDMPLDELERRVVQAHAFMQQAVDLFPGLVVMTDESRRYSTGRLRTGESQQFLTLISIMEAFPRFFEGLADLDEGIDPTTVETPLMRDRVLRADILARLLETANRFGAMSDTVLHLREMVRDPIKEAYGIAKSLANTNEKLKSMLAPVINFYTGLAKAAATTRKVNAEAAAAEKKAGAKG